MNDIAIVGKYLLDIATLILSIWYGLRFFLRDRNKTETIWYGIASLILYVAMKA